MSVPHSDVSTCPVRLLAMDVDGTLTDGHIYISDTGELCKAFHVRDGHAIKHFLPEAGIVPVIITGRISAIVDVRSKELGIEYVYQGISDKVRVMDELRQTLGLRWEEIAFIGDDVNDIPVLKAVGRTACPSDAVPEVKQLCEYVCQSAGGHGAVREWIDLLCREGKNEISKLYR